MNFHLFQMENSLFSGVPKFRQSTASLLGHLKTINFPFETNGKLMRLGVPILKHFRAFHAKQGLLDDCGINMYTMVCQFIWEIIHSLNL